VRLPCSLAFLPRARRAHGVGALGAVAARSGRPYRQVAARPSDVVLETVVDAYKRIRIVGGIAGELIHLGSRCCMPGTRSTGSSTRRSPSLTRIDVYKYVAYDGLQRLAAAHWTDLCALIRFRLHRPRDERAAC
jgi:hypothetical protein